MCGSATLTDPLTFEVIEKPEAGCSALTYPRFWSYWSSGAGGWLGVVARRADGAPAGLALLGAIHARNGKMVRRLLSLAVERSSRNTGIGRTLLTLAETVARSDDLAEMFALYSSRMASLGAFENVLVACGWEAPRASECRLVGEVKWVFDALNEWSFLLERLRRGGFCTASWRDLSAADHRSIAEMFASERVHPDWQPGPHMDETSSDFSLLMYHGGEIAGWIVGCKQSESRVCYPLGYALPRYQRRGYLIAGLMESCVRQSERLGGDSVAVHWTPAGSAMHKFMETRLRPHLPGQADVGPPMRRSTDDSGFDLRYLALKRM